MTLVAPALVELRARPTQSPEAVDLSFYVQPREGGLERIDLAVEGADCAACIPIIETAMRREAGVVGARVNLTNRRVTIDWRAGETQPAQLVAALARIGYRAHPYDPRTAETQEAREAKDLLRRLGVAGFAMMNIMLLSVSVWSGNATDITPEQRDFFHWLSALIAIPAVAYAGRPFFESAARALAVRALNMDVPISLGVTLAVTLSVVETLHHGEHAYFDSAVMLLFFLLTGRYLDQLMRRKTRAVAANIAALKAETAVKVFGVDMLREVPIATVKPGDLVLARPGERLGVDGLVEEGRSAIDQSLVTGETRPVIAGPGSAVHAGTMNLTGVLRVRVRAAEAGTWLDEVTRLMETATQSRSAYVRLADRAARLYSPVVHLAAFTTFLGWIAFGLAWQSALVIAITVLIITCPCALALAIPTVQVVASGALFRAGILLQAGDGLERLAEIDCVAFDKTGTLTLPEPGVTGTDAIPADCAEVAARLAAGSKHPLARAVAALRPGAEPPADLVERPGEGVEATIGGRRVRLGSPAFCGAETQAAEARALDPEASLIAFADGEARLVFRVRQALRPDARATIERLRAMGLDVFVLSGDRPEAVASVAHALGVTRAEGGLAPAEKIARLEAEKAAGRRVLMVGDGLNDAPALAAAHVSLSPVTAAHLTQAAADAVFMGDSLKPVASAVAVSRRARRLMGQNLWIAVVYNAIAVPIAILGHVTPLVAALAMSGSSLIVTANALRGRAAD